ncbi:uncharacterized protein LOC144141746 [Haemaphysalis longicornis]
MPSVMAEHFKPYGWICRIAGIFFVKNLQSDNVDDLVITWKTWYSLYSVVCLLSFGILEFAFLTNNMLRQFDRVRSFTKHLFLVIQVCVTVKVIVNLSSAVFGSWTMLEFFRKAADYEKKAAFSREHYRFKSRISYILRSFILAAFVGHFIVNANMTVKMVNIGGNSYLEFGFKLVPLLFNFLFFVYDLVHFLVLRPCCEVMIAYIRHQHETLKHELPVGYDGVAKLSGVGQFERVRLNLCSIGNLRKLLNRNWQFSLMASAITILILTCICIYSTFDKDVSTDQLLLTMSYSIYATLDFVDVARLSQMMANEGRELKESLMKVSMFNESPIQFRQVSYLHNSIRPEEMSLSGGNFFSLNMPLLVSLAGSIITYSVILVQTSDSVEHLTVPKSNNTD